MRLRIAAAGLVTICATVVVAAPNVAPDRLLEHIRFLASDDLRGRDSGSEGLEKAAAYIADEFAGAGLRPGWSEGWLQPFDVRVGLAVGRTNSLTLSAGELSLPLQLGVSYYPLGTAANDDVTMPSTLLENLPVVFAGHGQSVPRLGYDDYAGLDVRGKAVLIFSHEPQENDTRSRLNGSRPLPETLLQAKANVASGHGARALLVVSDPTHRVDDADYRLFPVDPDAEQTRIPVLRLRRDDMKPLLERYGLEEIARQIDRDLTPRSQPLAGVTLSYREHLAHDRRTVHNVVGVLPGSDAARADEAVVIGAHYDHVGLGGRNSAAPERTGEIHNGADDNASGTAAIIEMAREAVRTRTRFPRTLVFVAFAAEEVGLLGSAHYVSQPAVPLDRTITMLNLDMVGRSRGSVDVSGIEMAPSLETQLREAMERVPGLQVRRQGPGAGRSDDSSFINRGIPGINFFTGFHNDYHRPTDDWEKIDAEGTRRVAMLALEFAASVAARDSRPESLRPRR
jgi:hypothetical protein